MDYPAVSVIIPVYNRYPVVCRAIDSVLTQTYPNVQCIVIDDASTDNTYRNLKNKYGKKIELYRNDQNSEKSASRNRAIKEACTDYVCFLDSDDIFT